MSRTQIEMILKEELGTSAMESLMSIRFGMLSTKNQWDRLVDRLAALLSGPGADRKGLEKLVWTHIKALSPGHIPTGAVQRFLDDAMVWASTGRTREQVREQVRERIAKIVIEKVYANLNPGGLTAKECELTKWLTNQGYEYDVNQEYWFLRTTEGKPVPMGVPPFSITKKDLGPVPPPPVWCCHMKLDQNGVDWNFDIHVDRFHRTENWKLCPICAAPRPRTGG